LLLKLYIENKLLMLIFIVTITG